MHLAPLFVLLLFALASYGRVQERIAILNTVDDSKPELDFTELTYLTNSLREIAVKMLPENKYFVMTSQSIIEMLGPERKEECKNKCLLDMGKAVSADYIGQARLGRLGGNYSITMELYHIRGNLIGSFNGNAKDVFGLVAIIDEKAPSMFGKMPGALAGSKAPSPAGGISGLQKTTSYEAAEEKLYVVNFSTDPQGAFMSFDGVPVTSCPKTPCKAELAGGNVRIIAALEQYERADTTILIKQNNQSISIKLKSNFGVLEIKPAYLDGIGKNEQWSLTINGKPSSSWENNLSPSKYSVKLSHECYENISFDVGINKGKREVFDMASNITLKKGGLTLSAERNGEPASEPVFVNGKQVGETPFSGSVPLCAKVEIGSGREAVDVKLKYNEKVKYTHKSGSLKRMDNSMKVCDNEGGCIVELGKKTPDYIGKSFTDSRDGKKYRTVTIGNQTWMAENLNYNASGSKCYKDQESNCPKYGRLYNWETAKSACPKGWHLPTKDEYGKLDNFVGGEKVAGKFLKATSGWNSNGNANDKFGFSALPGGYGNSDGKFLNVGNNGVWWSSSKYGAFSAYYQYMDYKLENVSYYYGVRSFLYSVRCLQD